MEQNTIETLMLTTLTIGCMLIPFYFMINDPEQSTIFLLTICTIIILSVFFSMYYFGTSEFDGEFSMIKKILTLSSCTFTLIPALFALILVSLFYEKIKFGYVSDEYYSFMHTTLILFIVQLSILFSTVYNSSMKEGKIDMKASKLLLMVSVGLIATIMSSHIWIILEKYRTDG